MGAICPFALPLEKQRMKGLPMGRFYGKSADGDKSGARYVVIISTPACAEAEIEVSHEIYELLDEMQREHWRLERRESRHSWHIEDMRESDLPHEKYVQTPEQEMMHRLKNEALWTALMGLPEVQRRRFLLHHLEQGPVKTLARIEGCSDRAIKYSLALARKNLREMLGEGED